jgi:hypothetical protein
VDLEERGGAATRRHPWELARAELFLRVLGRYGLLESGRDWLDVGSGDAWFAAQVRERTAEDAQITCWDVNYTQAELEEAPPGLTLVTTKPEGRFDRVLMLDVIEHVEDDEGFVAGVTELLDPGGRLLVSVPCYQRLFSSHDRMLHHFRRYSPDACRALLERCGLMVVAEGGLFWALLPLRAAQVGVERIRRRPRRAAGIGNWHGGATTTRLLTRAMVADGELSLAVTSRGRRLPGLSYWALCRPARADD